MSQNLVSPCLLFAVLFDAFPLGRLTVLLRKIVRENPNLGQMDPKNIRGVSQHVQQLLLAALEEVGEREEALRRQREVHDGFARGRRGHGWGVEEGAGILLVVHFVAEMD